MAGLYIHIPFCRTLCSYCDFYKSTNLDLKTQFLNALEVETQLRSAFLQGEKIETLYFGGGTPSVLTYEELNRIVKYLKKYFDFNQTIEFTFEANPDDATTDYLEGLKQCGVNRLSFGVQSFQRKHLREITRRHSVEQALFAVQESKKIGIENISLDLIYGLPHLTIAEWKQNIKQFISLEIPHLSAYHLIYEPGTRITKALEMGRIKPASEELSHTQFMLLVELLHKAGYEHYEISNFALPNRYSRHNSSYWKSIPYLGLGPSAHSFDGYQRSFNQSDLAKYIRSAEEQNTAYHSIELLTEEDRYNEMVMLGLRTMWGLERLKLEQKVSKKFLKYFEKQAITLVDKNMLDFANGIYSISKEHYLISDGIISQLFWTED